MRRPAWPAWLAPSLALSLSSCAPGEESCRPARLDGLLARSLSLADAGDRAALIDEARARGSRVPAADGPLQLVAILEPAGDADARDLELLFVDEHGATVERRSRSFARVVGAADALRAIARHPDVRRLRAPAGLRPTALGTIASEGEAGIGASALHDLGWTGEGVRVAVVDAGFDGLTQRIDEGELPADTVAVIGGTEVAWADVEVESPHGAGVAETVLDVAPGVSLACVRIEDDVDMENAADYLATAGARVVNMSLAIGGLSFYDGSGPFAAVVDASRELDDLFWAISAGNYARKHWRAPWSDGGDGRLDFDGDDHEMQLGDGGDWVSVYLQWDQYDQPETNLDLYVYAADGSLVGASEWEQSALMGYPPVEAVSFAPDDAQRPYQVVVEHRWGTTIDVDVSLLSFYQDLEHPVAAGSLIEPADARGAFTVAAVDWSSYDDAGAAVESFSSRGPTHDGRDKPELTGPDRVSTATYGDGRGWGTSFAAPHVAGIAALLLERDPAMTADQLAATLVFWAIDAGDAGYDHDFGHGLLWGDAGEPCVDGDGDGFGVGAFGNAACATVELDCDDGDEAIHPGAEDPWYDGIDSDCDGASDHDADGDGHDSDQHGGDDCDDDDPDVHPGADDPWYDGIDSDCDGANDHDADGDGHEAEVAGGDDCDDDDPDVHPGAVELCSDERDNDCDGAVDAHDDDCPPPADDDDDTGADDDDAGADDDAPLGEPHGGCACRTASTSAGGGQTLAVALAGLALSRRRRRRRSSR